MVEFVPVDKEDILFRRVLHRYILPDRISSSSFKDRKGKYPDEEASVDLAKLTTAEDCAARGKRSDLCVAALKASVPMGLDLGVEHDPYPDEEPDNYAHALILGNNSMEKCEKMARALVLVLDTRKAS